LSVAWVLLHGDVVVGGIGAVEAAAVVEVRVGTVAVAGVVAEALPGALWPLPMPAPQSMAASMA
jgi:hypothetical protein